MVKNSYKQTGSAHVATIASLVILLIGALGYIFWSNYMAKNDQQAPTVQSARDNSQATKDTPTTDEHYITMEDWGVKFRVDEKLSQTAIGKIKLESADSYLFFSERVNQAFKVACPGYPNSNSGAGWNLIRFTEKPQVDSNGNLLEMNGELITDAAINGYFYAAGWTGTYCPSEYRNEEIDGGVDYSGDHDAVLSSIRTLQSIK